MPDYGSWITDAKGVLHDLSKHAFDAYHHTSADRPLNATIPALKENFTSTFSVFKEKIVKKLGIDPEAGLSLEEIGDQMKDKVVQAGTRMALETAAGYGLKYATELEGPLGLLFSEALTIVTSELMFAVAGGSDYKPGQWVFIDCGLKTRLINQIPKVIELASQFDVFSTSNITLIPDDLDFDFGSAADYASGAAPVLGRRAAGRCR